MELWKKAAFKRDEKNNYFYIPFIFDSFSSNLECCYKTTKSKFTDPSSLAYLKHPAQCLPENYKLGKKAT